MKLMDQFFRYLRGSPSSSLFIDNICPFSLSVIYCFKNYPLLGQYS
jgi:hypothetical protein